MAGEDFLLKWNDHHSLFFAGAEELCQSEEYTDVTLSAGSRFFPAHKLVLSVCSPYFRQLFARLGNQKSVIYLKDVEPKHLELLLEYMYKGEIKVEEHELVTVLNTAQGLEIRGLTESGKASESDSPTKAAPPALLARPVPPPKRVATPTSPPTRLQQPPSQTFESASKKRKTAPTSSDTLFKIGAVDVTPAPDSPQPPILPSPARERPSVPARPAPPPAPPSQPIVSVKQEVTPTQQDWNSSQSDHQMATYEDSMSQDSYTDTSMAVASYDQGGGYEEGEYYQDDQIGHGEQDDRVTAWMNVPDRYKGSNNCPYCQRRFSSNSALKQHMPVHTGEKPYACNMCDARFTQSSSLYKHIKKQNCILKIA